MYPIWDFVEEDWESPVVCLMGALVRPDHHHVTLGAFFQAKSCHCLNIRSHFQEVSNVMHYILKKKRV